MSQAAVSSSGIQSGMKLLVTHISCIETNATTQLGALEATIAATWRPKHTAGTTISKLCAWAAQHGSAQAARSAWLSTGRVTLTAQLAVADCICSSSRPRVMKTVTATATLAPMVRQPAPVRLCSV